MLLIIWPFWTLWRGTFGGYTSHDHPWEEAYTRDFADPPPRCLRLSFEVCGAERDTGGGEIAKVCVCVCVSHREAKRDAPHLHGGTCTPQADVCLTPCVGAVEETHLDVTMKTSPLSAPWSNICSSYLISSFGWVCCFPNVLVGEISELANYKETDARSVEAKH